MRERGRIGHRAGRAGLAALVAAGLLLTGATAATAEPDQAAPGGRPDSGPTATNTVTRWSDTPTVVRTRQGLVRGKVEGDSVKYLGLPYAAPPLGALRWKAPAPAPAHRGIRDATTFGPACPQDPPALDPGERQSEDCLIANVTVPRKRSLLPRPVFVWIHGGGGVQGSGTSHEAARLADRGDMVVVTVNYRLGIWGNLTLPELGRTSNFELQDQQAAMRWARDNARAFGGNPANVTLGGESNGAFSVCSHLNSPTAKGLFNRVILSSGACGVEYAPGTWGAGIPAVKLFQPATSLQAQYSQIAASFGCRQPRAQVDCLRKVPADQLLKASAAFTVKPIGTTTLPVDPNEQLRADWARHLPVLSGSNRHEDAFTLTLVNQLPKTVTAYRALLAEAFGPANVARIEKVYPAANDAAVPAVASEAFSDYNWTCSSLATNRYYARTSPVWTYLFADLDAPGFDDTPTPPRTAAHGEDVFYLFYRPEAGLTPIQRALSNRMIDRWAAFIHYGNPNRLDAKYWPSYRSGRTAGVVFDTPGDQVVDLAKNRNCAFWAGIKPPLADR